MNILLYDFLQSYIQQDLLYFLKKMGHHCRNVPYSAIEDRYHDESFDAAMEKELQNGGFDLVMTTNFWPIVARVCQRHSLPYVSWIYDSPPNLPTTECMEYACNRIYFFARADYERYQKLGLDNVYYLPLAVNTERLDRVVPDVGRYACDISFVGNLYHSILPQIYAHMDGYTQGYMDAIQKLQTELYGSYILDDMVTEELAEDVRKQLRLLSAKAIQPKREELAWEMAAQITKLERMTLLAIMSHSYKVDFYTCKVEEEVKKVLTKVKIHGPVDYMTQMPQVFKASRINLCPVLKANRSGIPLRALDIMGCGGFLLSSFQEELYEYFAEDEECVLYTSMDDAVQKADFYMKYEDLRRQIAAAGLEKVRRDFRYEDRLSCIMEGLIV